MSRDGYFVKVRTVPIRSAFYVDGFNLYHAIAELNEPFLKWLNLWKMAETIIPKQTEQVVRVVFCTAYYPGDHGKRWRHDQYKNALEIVGVSCVFGHYVHEEKSCRSCGETWQQPGEKQTDINIALSLYDDAYRNVFDKAYLVTADSDQAATASFLKSNFPDKQLISVAPPGRNFSANICSFADGRIKLTKDTLEKCLFPPIVVGGTANPSARRPKEYEPPSWWVPPNQRPS